MYVVGFSRLRSLVVVGFLCLFSLFPIGKVYSQEADLKVFPNQYVVEPAVLTSGMSAGQVGNLMALGNAVVKKKIAQGVLLVEPSIITQALAINSNEPVPFDKRDDFCLRLIKSGAVKSCSPNYEMRIAGVPNDPRFANLWGLSTGKGINAAGAWDIGTGTGNTVVAVIDTGIDYTHPDLIGNVWVNPGEVPGNGLDDDGNGYIDDVHGISTLKSKSGDPLDDNGHGTHVSGTIGARGNNSVGVAGVNWNVKIMGLKFLNGSGSGSLSGAIQAINYMIEMKKRGVNVRISNNSWGGGSYSAPLFNAIKRAHEEGIIFVAAAGNSSNNNDANPSYPGGYELDNVVSVAAIDKNGNIANFSNYGGSTVDIAAPGVSILSTYPGNKYKSLSGTSMAAPHVAGALALLLSTEAALTNGQLIQRVYESALPRSSLTGVVITGRTLNIYRMLGNLTEPLPVSGSEPNICQYSMEVIDYKPDYSADQSPVVLQSDELNFTQIDLPFNFPFYGEFVDRVKLSPNGVIYLKDTPTTMDYKNSSVAPLSSVAALHTDMTAPTDPYGVRVAVSNDRATVFWKTVRYGSQHLGEMEVRTTLYSDGKIESFLSLPSPDLENQVQNSSTVGISGGALQDAVTFAYNNTDIKHLLGVRWTPQCEAKSVVVSDVNAKGVTGRGKEVNQALKKRTLKIRLHGTGTGSVTMKTKFNGRVCSRTVDINVANGTGEVLGTLPAVSREYRRVSFLVGSNKKSLRIKHKYNPRKNSQRSRKIGSRRTERICNSLMKSIR